MRMILKFVTLMLSDIRLTFRLIHPRRIKNALLFLISDHGNLSQLYRRYQSIYESEDSGRSAEILASAIATKGERDILIFPIIDWDFRYQRPQHIATNLAKLGYRVFYFSTAPLMTSDTRKYKLEKTSEKLLYLCKLRSRRRIDDNLHYHDMDNATRAEYAVSALTMMQELKIENPVIILNHFYWAPLCRELKKSALIYDCMDHHVAFIKPDRTDIPLVEKRLIEEADAIITSSEYLYEKIKLMRANTIIRNGCDSDFFSSTPEVDRKKNRPVVGYIGAIAEWFDIELLTEVAALLSSWHFVLVGSSVGCDTKNLRNLPNVTLVGEVDYSLVPNYLAQFDVCIIPFKLTELTRATNPVKVYEYLSAGRPVVSTPLPEVLLLKDYVFIADNPKSFVKQLNKALTTSRDRRITDEWRAWAKNHDWSIRAHQFATLIEGAIEKTA